jgi:hypothetical protein
VAAQGPYFSQLKKCRFSQRSKRIITAILIVAAVGASDWGVQSVILGMLKVISDEIMEIDLSHKALLKGCLKNWEFNLVEDCLGEVIWQITKDAKCLRDKYDPFVKVQISLVTDHGNCEGVDHFVKMICSSSVLDEKGNHILKHFNLDIDKGEHLTEAAANTILRSLQALEINNDEVEIAWIWCDSSGSTKVQMPNLRYCSKERDG